MTGSVSKYPACVVAQQAGTSLGSVYVGIKASMGEAKINAGAAVRLAFPLGLWTALVIHIIGVELYVSICLDSGLLYEHLRRRMVLFVDSFDGKAKSASGGIYPYKRGSLL